MSTTAEKVGRVISGIFAAANAVSLILLLNAFLRIRMQFAMIFKDMMEGTQLPTITAMVFAVSPTVLTVVAIILLVLLIAKEWLRPVWVPMFLNGLWLALGCGVCFLVVMALFAPMFGLVAKVSN